MTAGASGGRARADGLADALDCRGGWPGAGAAFASSVCDFDDRCSQAARSNGRQEQVAGARVARRSRAPGLVVPGRTIHSSGEPPLRSIHLVGVRSAESLCLTRRNVRDPRRSHRLLRRRDSGHFSVWVPIPSKVTRRQGRSGRLHPLAFKVPGKPINRAGLAVAVSILTVLSLYFRSRVARVLARRAA